MLLQDLVKELDYEDGYGSVEIEITNHDDPTYKVTGYLDKVFDFDIDIQKVKKLSWEVDPSVDKICLLLDCFVDEDTGKIDPLDLVCVDVIKGEERIPVKVDSDFFRYAEQFVKSIP